MSEADNAAITMPKQPKGLSEKEKAAADEVERAISDNLAARADKSVNSDNNIPKLNKYTHTVNNDASVGLNGVPGQHEVSNTTGGNAFLGGMTNLFNTVGNAVGQGINKLGQALVGSGSASWFGGEDQKAAVEQQLRDQEEANRAAINEYQDYRNTLKEEHPIAFGAGDFLTKSQLYRGAGALGAATGAEEALAGKIGDLGANLALGQAADVALDTVPTEIENYQNGMRGKELAIDTAKNFGTNALYNLGAEGLQRLPGLIKGGINALNGRNTAEAAQEIAETAAKSAPTDALKQLEPTTPAKEINPVDLVTNNAEVEELAYRQQREVADAINNLRQQIPSQPVSDTVNTGNKSALQEITDSIINTRNTENLVGNGNSEVGRAYLKNIDELQNQEKNILKQAEKITNDPALEQLKDEVVKTGDAYWNTIQRVDSPINPEAVNIHRQALENLENYMKDLPQTPEAPVKYGKDLKRYAKELEMSDDLRNVVDTRIKDLDGFTDRIRNAKSKEEVESIVREVENMVKDTDNQLMKNASYRTLGKYDLDNETKTLAQSLDKRKIYISPELREEFRGSTLKDLESRLYFNSNEGRMKPKLLANSKNGTALDKIFPEIDREAGGAISNYMKNNGLNPEVAQDQLRGMLEYADSLKAKQNSAKLRPYEGGMLDEWLDGVRKSATDKINSFEAAPAKAPIPDNPLKQLNKSNISESANKEIKALKQSFNGKTNYIKDGKNEYAIAFKKSLDDLAKNPNADTYSSARNALDNYIKHSRTPRMKSNTGSGEWYTKVFDNYDPETKTSPFIKSFEEFGDKYGLKQLDKVETPKPENIPNVADNKLKLDLQFFSDEAKKLKDILDRMDEGKDKNRYRSALEEFINKINNAKTSEEMAKAYKKVSKTYSNTLMNSGLLTEEEVAKHMIPDMFAYAPETERESLYDAILARNKEGNRYVKNRLKKDGFTGVDTDGMMLAYRDKLKEARALEEAGKNSDKAWEEANTIFRKIQKESSQHGQALQALAKWSRDTPEGLLCDAEHFVNKILVNKGKNYSIPALTKKIQKFEFSIKFQKEFLNEAEKIQNLDPYSREFKEGMAKLGAMVNDEVRRNTSLPKMTAKRVTATLMDNMLGNFRTLITRNAGGNLGLAATEQVATRPLAAAIDSLVAKKTGKRTQAGLSKEALGDYLSGFKKGLKEEAQDVKLGLHTSRSNEVSLEDAIARNTNVFKTDSKNELLQKLSGIAKAYDNAVAHGLSVGDRPFYEANYKQTLGDLKRMKSKGQLGEEIQKLSDKDFKTLSEGIAHYNALVSVYQNDSLMSDALLGFKNSIGELSEGALGFDILSQFTMPFVKTPANVVDRAIDYSPLGIVRNTARTIKEGGIGGENFNQNRFANETARNIIGTGLMTGAGVAASKGILSGKYSDDKDQKKAQRESGMQEYALNIPVGDDNYQQDISWIPIVGSNAVASVAAVNAAKDPELSPVDKALAGIKGGGKAMLDQSMFQGLQRLFGQGESYNSDEGIVGNMINTVKAGTTQAVPSLVRQGAQVADPYERDLSNGNYDINNIKNTVPGLRQSLQPKVDTEGEYVKQNQGRNIGMKVLEDMILPGKITKVEAPELTAEAQRLQELTGNNKAYQPKAQRKDITTDTYEPTDEEYTQYQVDRNKAMTSTGKELLKTSFYKSATPEQQEAMLDNMYSGIKDYAKTQYTNEKIKAKVGQAYKEGKEKAAVKEIIYHSILSEYGLKDGDNYRKLYNREGEKALKEYAAYKGKESKYKESKNIESMKKDDKIAFLRTQPLSTQKKMLPDMLESQEDKQRWEAASHDVNRYWKLYDAAQKKKAADEQAVSNEIKSSGINNAEQTQKELASYGANDTPTTVEYYAKAKKVIPSLSTKEYAGYLKSIGGADRKITQDELIDYANKNNLSAETINTYWKAFESKKGWKRIPKLENGKWKAK